MTRIHTSILSLALMTVAASSFAQSDRAMDRRGGGNSRENAQSSQRSNSEPRGRQNEVSRSGRVDYRTNNNVRVDSTQRRNDNNYQRSDNNRPVHNEYHPVDQRQDEHRNDVHRNLPDQVNRGDRNVIIRDNRHWDHDGDRHGYRQYRRDWRDDNFYYPWYRFEPGRQAYCSPWYLYNNLPPYISETRIIFGHSPEVIFDWRTYNYRPHAYQYHYDDDRYSERRSLDHVLDDLSYAFERQDRGTLDRYLPRNGEVAISQDGLYRYDLRANDFADMIDDMVVATRTERYQVLQVQLNDDCRAQVEIRHDYRDSWGDRKCVYHRLMLERERDGDWVIRRFGTSQYREY